MACTLTTPLDVAKTRVMTQNPSNPMIYLGLQATLQKIWLEEVSGLGTGMRDPLSVGRCAFVCGLAIWKPLCSFSLSPNIAAVGD